MKIVMSFLLWITLFFSSALAFAVPPHGGECVLLDYTQMEYPPDGWYPRFAHADQNEDGYICTPTYSCTVCPPNAQRCTLVCNFIGPVRDNE
jgi:hypothetical protein